MIYTRKEISNKYKSTYQLNRAIIKKEIFKVQNGIYSDKEYVNPLAIISKKYPKAVITMESAFYYWNLTDVIPEKIHLATTRNSVRFKENDIKQYFVEEDLFEFGKITKKIEGVEINIYDKERLLIELLRKKKQLPFDYYKEIILNYRRIIDTLDSFKLSEYISYYKNENLLYDRLQSEVY